MIWYGLIWFGFGFDSVLVLMFNTNWNTMTIILFALHWLNEYIVLLSNIKTYQLVILWQKFFFKFSSLCVVPFDWFIMFYTKLFSHICKNDCDVYVNRYLDGIYSVFFMHWFKAFVSFLIKIIFSFYLGSNKSRLLKKLIPSWVKINICIEIQDCGWNRN